MVVVKVGGLRIRKVVSHPTKHSCILSSVQGNNEISMWNLETGSREKVYWASKAPPLSKPAVSFFFVIYTFTLSIKLITVKVIKYVLNYAKRYR